MIEVLPIRDKSQQEAICFKSGIEYNSDCLAYAAYNDGEVIGVCQFIIKEDGARLIDLSSAKNSNSNNVLFVIGRAVLNFIDLCGVKKMKCDSDSIDKDLLSEIGFEENADGSFEFNIQKS